MKKTKQLKQQKKKDYKEENKFAKYRNVMAYQQGVLFCLLNEFFEITIEKPIKKSKVAHQSFSIKTLERNDDLIDIRDFIEQRCLNRCDNDIHSGVKTTIAKQRVSKNKLIELNLLLIDLLGLFGYHFERYTSEGKNGSMKNETLKLIFLNGKFVCNEKKIVDVGKKINEYCCEQMIYSSEHTFKINHDGLHCFRKELFHE